MYKANELSEQIFKKLFINKKLRSNFSSFITSFKRITLTRLTSCCCSPLCGWDTAYALLRLPQTQALCFFKYWYLLKCKDVKNRSNKRGDWLAQGGFCNIRCNGCLFSGLACSKLRKHIHSFDRVRIFRCSIFNFSGNLG